MNGTVAVAWAAEVACVGAVAFTDAALYTAGAAGAANTVVDRQSAAMQKEAVIIALRLGTISRLKICRCCSLIYPKPPLKIAIHRHQYGNLTAGCYTDNGSRGTYLEGTGKNTDLKESVPTGSCSWGLILGAQRPDVR